MSRHRYGELLVTIEDAGKFYWSYPMQVVEFVPKGCSASAETIVLTMKENTREGAIKKIMREVQKYPKLYLVESI